MPDRDRVGNRVQGGRTALSDDETRPSRVAWALRQTLRGRLLLGAVVGLLAAAIVFAIASSSLIRSQTAQASRQTFDDQARAPGGPDRHRDARADPDRRLPHLHLGGPAGIRRARGTPVRRLPAAVPRHQAAARAISCRPPRCTSIPGPSRARDSSTSTSRSPGRPPPPSRPPRRSSSAARRWAPSS